MPQIIYLQHIIHSDNSTTPIEVSITLEGCTVNYLSTQITVPWDRLGDVEYLSSMFGDVVVKAFKVIVCALGKIYDNKPMYMELLE